MIGYVLIQTNVPMPRGHDFICISKTVCIIGIKFKDPIFGIKERIVHSIFPLFLILLCYKIHIDFLLVKIKGNIGKEMVEKMNRRKSL